MRRSDVPSCIPPRFVILRLAVPSCASAFVSPSNPTPVPGPGVFGSGNPQPACRMETTGPPKFLGNLYVSTPCSLTPAGSVTSSHDDAPTRPPSCIQRRLPAQRLISGLNSTASTRAVYASPAASLQRTQDSLPAVGQTLRAGIGYPQGSYERFPGCFLHRFLLPQASLGANAMNAIIPLGKMDLCANHYAICKSWRSGRPGLT